MSIKPWHLISAVAAVLIAPAYFVFEDLLAGIILSGLALAAGLKADRGGCESHYCVPGRPQSSGEARLPSMLRDVSLIVMGLGIIRFIPLAADLENFAMLRFTLALGGAVLIPYLISRYVYLDRAISFPWRSHKKWQTWQWIWLAGVLVLGLGLLPWYFISTEVYLNWPAVTTTEEIFKLFIGVGAVGIWDELFFIATVFVLLMRHLPAWLANLLQSVVFVSFLWELGYQSIGPVLTLPFAIVQGIIFLRTSSLWYVVTTHLFFDAVVFGVLVYAHNR